MAHIHDTAKERGARREHGRRARVAQPTGVERISEIGNLNKSEAHQLNKSHLADWVYWELYVRNPWVRSVIDLIVQRAIRDPYRVVDKADPENYILADIEAMLLECNDRESFVEVLENHLTDLLIYGRAYTYKHKTRGGKTIGFYNLDVRITHAITDGHGRITKFCQMQNGTPVFFETHEIVYTALGNNGSEPDGISKLKTLYDSIAAELHAERFNSALFSNHLSLGVVISLPDATEAVAKENQQRLEEKYSKPENAGKPLVIRGNASLVSAGTLAIRDIAWEKLIENSRQKVCAVYNVAEFMLGITQDANKASSAVIDKNFWSGTVRPYLKKVYGAFTRQWLKPEYGPTYELQEALTNILPTDEEVAAAQRVAQTGARYDYILRLMNIEPPPNSDYWVMWTPAGYIRLDMTSMPGIGNADVTKEEAAEMLAATQAPPPEETEGDPVEGESVEGETSEETELEETELDPEAEQEAAERVLDLTLSESEQDNPEDRVIDMTRSETSLDNQGLIMDYQIARAAVEAQTHLMRRVPVNPGSRGGTGYYDAQGNWRYGSPSDPQNKPKAATAGANSTEEYSRINDKARASRERAAAAKKAARERLAAQKKAAREKDKAAKAAEREKTKATKAAEREAKKAAREKEKAAKAAAREAAAQERAARKLKTAQLRAARTELKEALSLAKTEGLTPQEVADFLSGAGWATEAQFSTPEDARLAALDAAARNSDVSVGIVPVGDAYVLVSKPLADFSQQDGPENVVTDTAPAKPKSSSSTSSTSNGGGGGGGGSTQLSNPGTTIDLTRAADPGDPSLSEAVGFGTGGEQSHPYMTERISETKRAFDDWAVRNWVDKVRAFAAES